LKSNLVVFGYDEVGNKVLELDELGKPNYWAYDQANRVRAARDGIQAQTYFHYDAVGQVRIRRDADNRETTFGYHGYDASRRPTSMSFSTDPWIYYKYDSLGNLTEVKDETGTFAQEYDRLDRLTKKITKTGTVYYEFDRTGLKTRLKDPDGRNSDYVYDAAGRLSKLELDDARTAYWEYDRSGLMIRRTSAVAAPSTPEAFSYYLYDVAGRTSSVFHKDAAMNVLSSVDVLQRNANGAVERQREDGGTWYQYFVYDALDRVTNEAKLASGGSFAYGFTYNFDAASNRTFKRNDAFPTSLYSYFEYNNRNQVTKEFFAI
jgi:YD repeat-containing protein